MLALGAHGISGDLLPGEIKGAGQRLEGGYFIALASDRCAV